MAKRKDIEAVSPDGAPEQILPQSEPVNTGPTPMEMTKSETTGSDLPALESPSISPVATVGEPAEEITPVTEPEARRKPIAAAEPTTAAPADIRVTPEPVILAAARPRFAVRPRHKRYALLAASVAIAAVLGAVVGVVTRDGLRAPPPPPRIDVAGAEERKAMQQSIARLAKEVTTLKTSLEAANKSAHSQIAKIIERFDRAASPEVTGSIASVAPAPAPVPLPPPRLAAVETRPAAVPHPAEAKSPPARPPVLQDWAIRDSRDGYVYVQGHGDIYQVVPGAPLPGLGAVESIKRRDGRWVVTTPKGIIVSMRDRRFFQQF